MVTVIELSAIPPSTNNLFFNKSRGGRSKSPEYVAWIKEAGWLLATQHPKPVLGKVKILIEVAEPETDRHQDVCNREKATTDLLVSHKIIEGDHQKIVREVTMKWAPIQGLRITITPMESLYE